MHDAETQERNVTGEPTEFLRFDFKTIPLSQQRPVGGRRVWSGEASVLIRGKTYRLCETVESSDSQTKWTFRIRGNGPTLLEAEISSRSRDDVDLATTDIQRLDASKPELPPGMGAAVYKKLLDFIATLPSNRPLVHRVIAAPTDEDMTKWLARFGPILEARGYEPNEDRTWWEKTYSPALAKAA